MSTTDERHQGYTNYETFSVGITLATDRQSYDRWLGEAHAFLADHDGSRDDAIGNLAIALRIWGDSIVEPYLDDAPRTFSSAFRAGYQAVDWHDIAREWVDLALETDA